MKRTSVFLTVAFLAGLIIGLFARSAGLRTLLRRDSHAADLAAIEKLHQQDIAATLSQDPKGLLDLWTEDAVSFSPGSPPDVGKKATAARNEKFHAQYPGFKVLSYSAKYKDLQIYDGIACEWGEHEAHYKLSADVPPTNWHGKEFHVLKRQNDGSWKTVVAIGN